MEKTETSGEGDVTITVRSTAEGARCHKCGQEIGRPYGHGREILLRHLSVFGRKTYIRICPPRYQCPRCEGAPVTTQKASWHDQRAPHTTAYEEYALFRMVSSTVEDVSIREYPGYEAVTGIINRRISTEVNWDETDKIDVIGLDEISLKKGHRDFVTTVTALTGGETMILAVLGNRKKETVRKFLKTVPKRLRKKVRGVCSDMCDGFINAVREVFGKRTRIIIDRFHVAQLYRKNLDKFRRKEMRRLKGELPKDEYGELKGAMWALRKKEEKLSEEEREVLKHLFTHSPELELAYNLCRELTDILEEDISRGDAKRRIRNWKTMVRLSGPDCFDSFLKTLEKLTGEITNYFVSRQTGGFAEGLNKVSAISSFPPFTVASGISPNCFAAKYLAIYFQVSVYEEQLFNCEPQMNADKRGRPVCSGLIRVHPCSSAVCESCFPRKKIPENFWPCTYRSEHSDLLRCRNAVFFAEFQGLICEPACGKKRRKHLLFRMLRRINSELFRKIPYQCQT